MSSEVLARIDEQIASLSKRFDGVEQAVKAQNGRVGKLEQYQAVTIAADLPKRVGELEKYHWLTAWVPSAVVVVGLGCLGYLAHYWVGQIDRSTQEMNALIGQMKGPQ